MSHHSRYAVYFMPSNGALADFGAAWLGWDAARGCAVPRLPVDGLAQMTESPRKYGFHATLKPPFFLADGQNRERLMRAMDDLATSTAPAQCDGLVLSRLGRFFALVPDGETRGITRIAAACVERLDPFRAPPVTAELARRRQAGLSQGQEAMLTRWGYPYVMGEFRFHMTLTGKRPKAALASTESLIAQHLPTLPRPFILDEISLMGERDDGYFECLHRYALSD